MLHPFNPLNSAATQLKPPVAKTNVDAPERPTGQAAKEGVRATCPWWACRRPNSGGNKDIEESGLPRPSSRPSRPSASCSSNWLKMQQMQAVMQDNSRPPDAAKVSSLQGEIATLTGAITTATANLNKAMKQENLSLIRSRRCSS